MKVLKFLGILFLFFVIHSCTPSKPTEIGKININGVTLSQYKFKEDLMADYDSFTMYIHYSDGMKTASYFQVSDSRWDSFPPQYYKIPDVPGELNLDGGYNGTLVLPLPKSSVYAVGPSDTNRFVYQVIIYSDTSIWDSNSKNSDSITVYR